MKSLVSFPCVKVSTVLVEGRASTLVRKVIVHIPYKLSIGPATSSKQVPQNHPGSYSQLQLRSDLGMLGLSPGRFTQSLFPENRSKDFFETLQLFRDRYSKKTDESFFRKKFRIIQKLKENCIFRWLFELSSKTTLTILLKSSEMVDNIARNNP